MYRSLHVLHKASLQRYGSVWSRSLTSVNSPARTRFAPSPTGSLHLGSLRTALYNYLWAKRTGGQFLLRVEDTDQKRSTPGAEESLFENLTWAGLTVDEGPRTGGLHASYRQSDRLPTYHQHVGELIDRGSAYKCFCTPDRLDELRVQAKKRGLSGAYDRRCATLSAHDVDSKVKEDQPYVIRLKSPDTPPIVEDLVHGSVDFRQGKQGLLFDDAILLKSDGYPTYHFANVVDDHLMKITHVIRGEEWLPSTAKHLAIYQAFGWTPPEFAHVPLLASVGGAKLSKRHGDTTVESYREQGFLPEAVLNYLALMGWNAHISPGESEVMSLAQMVEKFDLNHITKGAAIVTSEKLHFLQKQHYHKLAETKAGMERLVAQTQTGLKRSFEADFSDDYVARVIAALKERVVDPLGIPQLGEYFFVQPSYKNAEAAKFIAKFNKQSSIELSEVLQSVQKGLEELDIYHWTGNDFNFKIEQFFHETEFQVPNALVMGAIRYAIAAGRSGAGVKQIMEVIGRGETLLRLERARKHCKEIQNEPQAR